MSNLFHKPPSATAASNSNDVKLDNKWSNTKRNAYTKDILN